MFHLAGFGGAKTDSTANENAPAAVDNSLTVSANNRYIAPARITVFAATITNDTITRARINAPSLRNIGLPEIYPVTVSNLPATSPAIAYWEQNGPTILPTEEFGIDSSNGASTVDEVRAGLWFREQFVPAPAGPTFNIVGTSTITLVKSAWALGTITLDQVLPYGEYAVIGMHVTCTACLLARLVFKGANKYRPGCPAVASAGSFDQRMLFRNGRQGQFGRFISTSQPDLELFGTSAGSQTATVILDLVKTG